MLIFAVGDERIVREHSLKMLRQAVPDTKVIGFQRASCALEEIERGAKPDIVFSDVEMPGISGPEFAVRLKKVLPDTKIIFVNACPECAGEGFRTNAYGYLLKPLSEENITKELLYPPELQTEEIPKLKIKCFGHFEVYFKGEPVIFRRKQTKELLAYLIDREGAACTSEEIAAALWEESVDEKTEKQRVRNLISDLKSTLKEIGMDKVLIRKSRQIAVRKELLDCDYYRMLAGEKEVAGGRPYNYMVGYSWAELTNGKLYFRGK